MNILCMSNYRTKFTGNFINSLLALGTILCQDGDEIIYMFPLNDDGSECNWVEYMRNAGFQIILYDSAKSWKELTEFLFEIVEKYKIELIHSHFSCLDCILLWNQKLHSKVKILYHDHMDYVAEQPVFPQIRKQVKLAKRYRQYGIGVISVMKRKHFWYFLCTRRWYVPNALTFKRNVEYSMSRKEARNAIGVKDDEKLVIFLGWDIYRKGLDVAIKTIKEVRLRGVNAILGVVGFGEKPDSKTIDRINSIIGFNPRQDGVRFLNYWEDMFALHRAADVFLSASRTEAFSYAILEAISQNVPVVASNIPGTRWCCCYSKTLRFPSGNVDACARAILKASALRDTPSNYQAIIAEYNIDEWCNRIIDIYKCMLKD